MPRASRHAAPPRMLLHLALSAGLATLGCSGGGTADSLTPELPSTPPPAAQGGGPGGDPPTIIDEDTTLESLTLTAEQELLIINSALLTITGDADIAGTLRSQDSPLRLVVQGDLSLSGTLQAAGADGVTEDPDTPLGDQPRGLFVEVDGMLNILDTATIQSDGAVAFTDSAAQLARPMGEQYDEAESTSGDLPTLLPLEVATPELGAPAEHTYAPVTREGQASDPPIVIGGTWDYSGAPGDKPILVFRFDGERDLIFDAWDLTLPKGANGAGQDASANPGANANGANGKNGMNLLIWNNNGPVIFKGATTISLADGGDGGDATCDCATARGGNGGVPGNFRITGAGGIDFTGGTVVISPGWGGHGGRATVTKGARGATGCPGETGRSALAFGGHGGANTKKLFVRGNVAGIGRVSYGGVHAGHGGPATAEACDGGHGLPCCDGGPGGFGAATGGNGGHASLDLGNSGIFHTGGVHGGQGGWAYARGGNGGNGGDCKFGPAGNGGKGGDASATGGSGGNAKATRGATNPQGGHAGDAEARSGDGGAGGNTVFGAPGVGGAPGTPATKPGKPGTPDGLPSVETLIVGVKGPDGIFLPPLLIGVPWAAIPPGPVPPGPRPNPVADPVTGDPMGSMPIMLLPLPGAEYLKFDAPIGTLMIGNGGVLELELHQMQLISGPVGQIVGLEISPFQHHGISPSAPLRVQAFDAAHQPLGSEYAVSSLPANPDPFALEAVEIPLYEMTGGVNPSIVQIIVPPAATVGIGKLVIVDP